MPVDKISLVITLKKNVKKGKGCNFCFFYLVRASTAINESGFAGGFSLLILNSFKKRQWRREYQRRA